MGPWDGEVTRAIFLPGWLNCFNWPYIYIVVEYWSIYIYRFRENLNLAIQFFAQPEFRYSVFCYSRKRRPLLSAGALETFEQKGRLRIACFSSPLRSLSSISCGLSCIPSDFSSWSKLHACLRLQWESYYLSPWSRGGNRKIELHNLGFSYINVHIQI